MHPSPPPSGLGTAPLPGDHERWLELLDGLDPERLTAEFLRRVREIDDYREPLLPIARIRDDAVASFAGLAEALRTGDRAPTERIAVRVGSSRARAGVPLTGLMAAILLDFELLWSALCAAGRPGDAPLLLRHATTLWRVVDDYVRQTEHAYLAEQARMREESASVRRGLIAELLGDASPSAKRLGELAELLELDAGDRFAVAVAPPGAVAELRIEIAALEQRGHQVLGAYFHGGLALVVPRGADPDLAGVRALPLGLVDEVDGLARVAAAGRLAAELGALAEAGGEGAVTPRTGWSRLLRGRMPDLDLLGVFDVDAALAGCGPSEREHLLAAAASYLRTGSALETAAELYCHRNTVTNRLRRFAELTGIDVTVPVEAARAVIAFA